MIATYRSLVEPDALAALVRERYGLPVRSCTLIRSLTNDVYLVEGGGSRHVLKVYGPRGWSLDEVRWEQELARHLTDAGVPIAVPVPLTDGQLASNIDAAEGPRPSALLTFVEGDKPVPPFDDVLYHELGTVIARLHVAGRSFTTSRARSAMDLRMALEEPLERLVPVLDHDDRQLVEAVATEARARVEAYASDGLVWGIRQGDVSPDNTHRGPDGLVLHDLDQATPGWLAADLTGVWAFDHWEAFRAGYEVIRSLHPTELAALPWLDVVERIGNLAFHLIDKPATHGTESLDDGYVDRELAALREVATTLP